MQQAGAWQRLLRHVRPLVATPFLLEVGVGRRNTAPPLPCTRGGSLSPQAPPLPIFSANVDDMSGFELDFVFRSLSCAIDGRSATSEGVHAELLGGTMSRSAVLDEPSHGGGDAERVWRHVCDLIVMPDGCVAFGWVHNHALDLRWRHHVLGYVADIFERLPGRLWKVPKGRSERRMRQAVRMKWRHLPVMQWASRVSEADVRQAMSIVREAVVCPEGTSYELEDEVSACVAADGCAVSSSTTRRLLHLVEQRKRALPTGTAIALMRMLVCAHAAHANATDDGLGAALVATAVRVCALSHDSGCHRLLTWAAALIGADADGASTVTEAAAEALTLTLHDLVFVPGARRDAQLRDRAERYLRPLCDALFSEEALLLDSFSVFRSNAVLEVQLAAAGESQNAASAADSADAAMASRVLGQAAPAPSVPSLEALWRAADSTAAPPLPWVPGVGIDVKGCWCALLTHTTLLATQTRKRPRQRRAVAQQSAAEAAHHALRVSLARRCLHTPDEATVATHYSLLTHLFSAAAAPVRSLVLVHLGSHPASLSALPANDLAAYRTVMGLLLLFPALPLRALCGGSVAEACVTFASGKVAQLPCHTGADEDAGDDAVTIAIPKQDAARLAERLQGHERAMLCVVQMMGSTRAAFLVDELPMRLRTLLDSS